MKFISFCLYYFSQILKKKKQFRIRIQKTQRRNLLTFIFVNCSFAIKASYITNLSVNSQQKHNLVVEIKCQFL